MQLAKHYANDLTVLNKQYRIARSEYDILYFTYEYFSDDRNPDNDDNLIPAGVAITDAPEFHKELCSMLTNHSILNPTGKIAWSVPRGYAKSMFLSNVYPLHSIVFSKRKYIIILSETETASQSFVTYISSQLKFNQKLREDFGEMLSVQKGQNPQDNLEGFITTTSIKVKAASMGKQLRGTRHGSHRPDLIICDDLESTKNTNTKELREKNLHWFNSVITPVGTPEKTGFLYMGTLVHGDGLLPNILRKPEYFSKIYSAVISEPNNFEMWQKYEELLTNIEDENRVVNADNFYFENKAKMDIGMEVLWESRFPYHELLKIKADIGSRAFSSEYLNVPSDKDSQVFKSGTLTLYEDADLYDQYGKPIPMELYGFWDIAIGKNSRSDYNAIVTVGIDRRTGIIYVLDAWAAKIQLHLAKDAALEKIKEWKPRMFGVESVQVQYEIYRQLQQEVWQNGIYHTKMKPVIPKSNKEARIDLLEPLVEAGILRFKKDQKLLIEQLEQFPNGSHDDLPDALGQVVELAGTNRRRTFQRKPAGM